MEDENNVLFVRGTVKETTCSSADDVWDDTALITAYDKAINLAKDEVAKRIGMEVETVCEKSSNSQNHKKLQQTQKPFRKWTIGAPCRAVYSSDGEIYEAIVTKVYENTGTCIVKFIGYGNTEKVELSRLQESEGLESQIAQQKAATACSESQTISDHAESNTANGSTAERMDYESERSRLPKSVFNPGASFNSTYGIMPPAPPIPPQLMAKLPDNDADALSSMLMSWYISGFHTGYYHGIKQARHLEEKRKK